MLAPDHHDARLARVVTELLTPVRGRDVRVDGVTRSPSPFATLFPAEVLTVSVEDGAVAKLFLKHLGGEQSAEPDKQCRDREVRVYEELLCDHGLPVATYYGSRLNGATGRHELYLEYVDDWHLKYHVLEHWFTASRRLARFHAHFGALAERLRRCDFLLVLDGGYFTKWAQRAFSAVAGRSADLSDAMGEVLAAYGPVCDLLSRQPQTLVHNDLAPKNVIADRSATPARICFVDWEMAGVGCGLLDLVHLKYGLDADGDGEMVDAYRAELGETALVPADDGEFDRVLAACELHKTLYRLAHCDRLGATPPTVARWVADARGFLERV